MDAEKLRVTRDKLTRVFRYLQTLNEHRNPPKRQIREQPWSLRFLDLPEHSSIQRNTSNAAQTKSKGTNSKRAEDQNRGYVLKVQRPRLTRPPEPPEEIAAWLEAGWDDPTRQLLIREKREESEDTVGRSTVTFAHEPMRAAILERWKLLRDEWAEKEKPARAAMKIFETLYGLYGRIDREAERVELVLGDGILSWHRGEGSIYHPILLQRLQLQFDASLPEFTLSEADHPVELYSALFQSMSEMDGRAIGRCREELEQEGFHPLMNGSTSGFLKRLVIQLSPRGEFLEDRAPELEAKDPCIGRDPLLFLRPRTLGFAAAIEGILADLRTREDLPWSLLNIVGEESPIPEKEETSPSADGPAQHDEGVLLSKPVNPEQIRIAQQLEAHGGVLVQGPPGTGKTHTIGNLVGHLLAQGKSVLVTSHTTKALRMVRHHIVPELRPLCVSVLESDLESRKQLESAVGSIAERLSRADAGSLDLEAKKLESERLDLLKKLEEIRHQLMEARADEYREITMAGKSWAPADAARKVVQEKEAHGWIPGPVAAVAPLPLSPGELADLYRTSVSLTREDEMELSGHLPELFDLPTSEDFEASLDERNRLESEDLELRSDLWDSNATQSSPEEIEALAAALAQAVEPFSGREKWKLAAVYAGRYGDVHRQPWDQLVSFVRLVHRDAATAQESILKYGPVIPDSLAFKDQERIASEILAHLENGGRLGSITLFMHKSWSQFIEHARVNNDCPRLPEHFHALRRLLRLKNLREDLGARWDRQMAILGTPQSSEMGEEVEKTLMQYCDSIEDCLGWHQHTWTSLQRRLEDMGFHWDKFLAEQPAVVGSDGELVRIGIAVTNALLPILNSRFKKTRLLQLQKELLDLKARLKLAARVAKTSTPNSDLKADDLRRQLIQHAEDPARLMRALEEKEKRAQSAFEREVMRRLASAGYRVTPHWKIGTFRIDLVVEGNGKRLAIECDGDRYYPLEKLPEDMDRQSVLERMGWVFTRIRSSEFLRNPARAMKPVLEKLQMLEIPAGDDSKETEPPQNASLDVIDRLIRRAEELRKNWSKANGAGTRSSTRVSATASV